MHENTDIIFPILINAGNWVDSAQDRNYWRTLVNAALNSGFHKPLYIYLCVCVCVCV